ncbi:MAG: Diguanylate cyclase with sensor [Modestobacter sp.]|jgi:diguanylate cyclase (GGDEF)-like protein|nr:Diguanylate cyclase with sensor [Modestobacter sp.]HEV7871677.1 GGDEF domain-containing protein [Modestobacter sp.]
MDAVRLEKSQDLLVQTAAVVAAQREFASRLRTRTIRDPLTGLPVRSLLVDRLELSLAAAGPGTGRLAVVSCDLDGLAALDHRHNPTIADTARSEVAGRLVAAVRQGDLVARVGTQTFVLLCPGIVDSDDAESIAGRVAASFAEPLRPAPDVTAHVRISVGVALSGRDSTPASLLAAADQAMARARADRLSAGRTD